MSFFLDTNDDKTQPVFGMMEADAAIAAGTAISRGQAQMSVNHGIDLVIQGGSRCFALGSVQTTCAVGSPTSLDESMLPTVLGILQRLGRQTDFVVPVSYTYDPATGIATPNSPTTYTAQTSPPLQYKDSFIDGDVVRRGDAQLILAGEGLAFTPDVKLEVQFDGTSWRIVEMTPLYSGVQIAAYVFQLRGGSSPTVASTTVQSTLDGVLPAVAVRLLDKFGKNATFVLTSVDDYDPGTGVNSEEGLTEFCEKIVLDRDRKLIKDVAKEEQVLAILKADGLEFVPAKAMNVMFDGKDWECVAVEPIYTGGKIGAWELELAR